VVDSDLTIGTEIHSLKIVIEAPPGAFGTPLTEDLTGPEGITLPATLALIPKDENAPRRFRVVAAALAPDGSEVVRQSFETGFVRRERRRLDMSLDRACLDLEKRTGPCSSAFTCSQGQCQSAIKSPQDLPRLNQGEDASPPDAGSGEAARGETGADGSPPDRDAVDRPPAAEAGVAETGAADLRPPEPETGGSTEVASDVDAPCDSSAACLKKLGERCAAGGECASGSCVDQVCCVVSACGPCAMCNGPTPGSCFGVGNGMPDSDSCAGSCWGAGRCCAAGCWDGAACVSGTSVAACGKGGNLCRRCSFTSCLSSECALPSCVELAATCGPTGNESCCISQLIPGGTFNRGNDPAYPATISDFRLDAYEITVGRFRKFVDAGQGTQAAAPATGAGANPNAPGTGWNAAWNVNLPASTADLRSRLHCSAMFQTWADSPAGNEGRPLNCVSWYEAAAFCTWDAGWLPTEAEWNYAAAGGNEQRMYPWGAAAPDASRASFQEGTSCIGDGMPSCALTDLITVGSKPAGNGRWGHSDLGGNVFEWTFDWFASPYANPCTNCVNLMPTTNRTGRGGSFNFPAARLATGARSLLAPGNRNFDLGFRCARSP